MGGEAYYLDIIIFALIAAFLVYKLRSVLGKRHGDERQRPNPFARKEGDEQGSDNVVPMPGRGGQQTGAAQKQASYHPDYGDTEVGRGIAAIQEGDPEFEPADFLEGARAAFSMVVEAFAEGNLTTLRSMLDDEVYQDFESAIAEREEQGESLETHLDEIVSSEIIDARLSGRTAKVTVRFVTRQRNVTKDKDGHVVDGDPETAVDVTDIWTFSRDTRSPDPNWVLEATAGEED